MQARTYHTDGLQYYESRFNHTLSLNTWTHIAYVRSGSSFYLFVDGTQIGTTTTGSNAAYPTNANLQIGTSNNGEEWWEGYIDEFRYSNTARWTANFTPPSSAYDDTVPTIFMNTNKGYF
jgi:hypothetical protein